MSRFLKAPLLTDRIVIVVSFIFIQILSRWIGKAYQGLGEAGRLGKAQVYVAWVSPLSQISLVALGWGVFGALCGQVFGNAIVVVC